MPLKSLLSRAPWHVLALACLPCLSLGACGDDHAPPVIERDGCIPQDVGWEWGGGLGAEGPHYTFQACNALTKVTYDSDAWPDFEIEGTCETQVAATAKLNADDVEAALAHPDVQAAYESATQGPDRAFVFGSTGVDAGVFVVRLGERHFTVGEPCKGEASCRPLPAGVQALRATLEALAEQQEELPCLPPS
jgi:hypothetical protein